MPIKFKIFDKTFPHSTGIYGTARFQNSDELEAVKQNHHSIAKDMDADNLLIINHVFDTHIIDADLITNFDDEPDADAALTSKPGILLCIQTADCVPIMLASEDDLVIGAAHCSWHTAKDDILDKLVQAMKKKGAQKIRAIMGPAIHQKSYEVDSVFRERIIATEPDAAGLFIPSKKSMHFMFDLPGFCLLKLKQLGITNITDLCRDTYADPEKYYSYRRDTHLGIINEKTNILSTIMILSS